MTTQVPGIDVAQVNNPEAVRAPAGKFRVWKAKWESPRDLEHEGDVSDLEKAIAYYKRWYSGQLADIYIFDEHGVKRHEQKGMQQLPA